MRVEDIEKISKKLNTNEIPSEKLPLILEIASWAADVMLSRILGVLGLDQDAAKLLWNWVNSLWNKLLNKLVPNKEFARVEAIYRERLEYALREYLKGKEDLLDALIDDIAGR